MVMSKLFLSVPSAHPEVAQGGYELTPGRALGDPTQRTLRLYWKVSRRFN